MITLDHYFTGKKHSDDDSLCAKSLLAKVNTCLHKANEDGAYEYWINHNTNSQISGSAALKCE